MANWGRYGNGNGAFFKPTNIGVDGAGNVYVPDTKRIQKFGPDSTFLAVLETNLWLPTGSVAVDHDGNIYAFDYERHKVQVYQQER